MVQLKILSEGESPVRTISRFPYVVGRSPTADLQLEEAGVWDRHLQLELDRQTGLFLTLLPGALASVNGLPVDERAALRNGDVIEAGAARFQFWLGPTRQRSFAFREAVTWVALAILCLVEIAVIYALLH